MIVTKCAGSSGVGGTGNLAFEIAVPFVVVGSFESGGSSSVVVAVHLMPECMGYSAEHFVFDDHHPSPLQCFYKWGNLVPIHISPLSALVLPWHGGLPFLGAELQLLLWWRIINRGNWPVLSGLCFLTMILFQAMVCLLWLEYLQVLGDCY